MSDIKQILGEELKVSAEKLKSEGVELGKEALEKVAKEMSDMFGRVAVRTENKTDDFFLMIKPMLDTQIDKISDAE